MNIRRNRSFILLILLSICSSLSAQQTLTLEQEKAKNHGIGIDVPANTPLRHFFQSGVISHITANEANFGQSITVLTETEIVFKGNR